MSDNRKVTGPQWGPGDHQGEEAAERKGQSGQWVVVEGSGLLGYTLVSGIRVLLA